MWIPGTIFEDSGPPGPHRKEIMLEYCMKAIMESAEFFISHISNELNLQKTISEDTTKKLKE